MICPDFFGCSGKLGFSETQSLSLSARDQASGSDFSSIATEGHIVTSIDRVHRCTRDWDSFARIALNHAFGDVICAGATPVQAMLSYEFGLDSTQDDYAACSGAFARQLAQRGVALGKCHSGSSDGITAVTIATLAKNPARLVPCLEMGSIYLSRPIGALKVHYLEELEESAEKGAISQLLEEPNDENFRSAPWALLTDVSGHGMLGAAAQVAQGHALHVELDLSAEHAISPAVLSQAVDCLQNPLESYGFAITKMHPSAQIIATLRETAGPFLGFWEDGSRNADRSVPGLLIGRYRRGDWKVDISWSE